MNDVFAYDAPTGAATTLAWHATGATPACTTYPLGDDDWADVTFPAGFTFTFAGVARTGMRVYSNGMLAFGGDTSGYWRQYNNLTLPITAASGQTYGGCPNTVPSNLIIAYWTDIVAGTGNATTGASVQYELLGTAPSRRLVISWVNVKLYNQTARYNFQILLYESPAGGLNSNFKYQYTTGSSTGAAATVGVQVGTADSTLYSFNQAFIDPVAGSAILWYPSNQLAGKGAEYRFDEGSWNGTSGEVKDTSGSGMDAVRVGAAINIPGGRLCRGGSFPANTLNTTIDAVATPIMPSSVGSIDFWYRSAVAWNSANAMLFDATTIAARPFYLMKTSAGRLQFTVTDNAGTVFTTTETTAQTFAANNWEHVGVSWNMRPGTNQTLFQIFLNGVVVPSTTTAVPAPTPTPTAPRTTSSGVIATLSTLYIGDNRTSGVTPSGGSPNSANGSIDEVYIYPTEINASQASADMNLTRPTCSTMDHFHIVHSGSLVNCGAASNVTIEAHDVSHALFSLAGTTLNLSTSTAHGTWSNVTGGSINLINNLGAGSATYTFSNEASVTFGLADSFIESVNINTVSGAFNEHTGAASACAAADYTFGTTCDANLSFDQAGFRFVDASGSNVIASQSAGTASSTYYLQAVASSCTTPGVCSSACTSVFPSGTAVNIDLASECTNPTACQAGQAVTFGAAGTIGANNAGAVSASTGTYSTKSLTFVSIPPNLLPAVPFTVNYSDAGEIKLWARYTGGTNTISGSSGKFVVAPARFGFSAVTAGPIKAGNNFNATIAAQNSAGATTPNFGNETPTVQTATLAFTKCQPAGTASTSGILTGAGTLTFINGAISLTNLNWNEVGNLDLTATSSNYLNSGLSPTGNTGTGGTACNGAGRVGNFIPDHFDTAIVSGVDNTATGGNSFTYSGQPFTVTVTARNGLLVPTTTANYDGSANTSPHFARAATLSVWDAATGTVANPGPGVLGGSAVALTAFATGAATTAPAYTFAAAQTAPASIRVRAVDTDGVTSLRPASTIEGWTEIRSGRWKVFNAYGSELLRLNVTVGVQYYSALSGWINNPDDSSTAFDSTLSPAGNLVAAIVKGPLAAVTIFGPASGKVAKGVRTITLGAPGAGNAGVADLSLNAPAYLLSGSNGAGVNPSLTGRVTFGVYKNNNNLLYRLEQ